MDINRNQYFFLAVLLMLIGLQLRMVQSYVLTPEATRFLAARTQASSDPVAGAVAASLPAKTVSPPDWTGWCLMSVGAVLFFHSLAMKKPGG